MTQFEYVIKDELGIHARPAGLLVKEAQKCACKVTLKAKGKSADAKKIFTVMSLGVKCGDTLTVICDGENEETSAKAIEEFLGANL